MLEINKLHLGDCLDLMKEIPEKSVDMILCDLPYQVTTRQQWDVIIPFDKLWENYERIIKENGIICLTATEPFRTKLISSNFNLFKYDLIWEKNKSTGFLNSKKQPLRNHESVLIFYKKQPTYNPQKTEGKSRKAGFKRNEQTNTLIYGHTNESKYIYTDKRFPVSVLKFDVLNNDSNEKFHSAQKPVELLEYLIKTYTNENDLILDNCAGSGSTLVAARRTSRNFIGIEKEEKFWNLANERLLKSI